MLTSDQLFNLIGRYQKLRSENNYRDEDDDLHIISVDADEVTAFIDFSANPEWVNIEKYNDGLLLGSKYLIDPKKMTYKNLEDI